MNQEKHNQPYFSENKPKLQVFHYTYSASRAEEIAAIRKKYLPNAEDTSQDKLEELRKLDQSVNDKATVWALVIGILSTLIMGTGMSLVMALAQFVLGILVGALGIAGVIAAYPIYRYVLEKERTKAAPRVLQLTKELSQE